MRTLYLDGFRGFEKTYLPLPDVSFFVGENSTGKTSVLSAIQILSESKCWFSGHFSSDEVNLGGFRDIVPPGRSYFQIGFFSTKRAVLLTFTPEKGAPVLSGLRLLNGTEQVRILRKNKDIFVSESRDGAARRGGMSPKGAKKKKKGNPYEVAFEAWLEGGDPLSTSGMRKVNMKDLPLPETASLMVALSAARMAASEKDAKDKRSFTFSIMAPQTLLNSPVWVAPVRAKPRRTYDTPGYEYSSEGEHLPQLLNAILGLGSSNAGVKVIEYGAESGLFKKVDIHRFGEEEHAPVEITVDLGGLTTSIFNAGYGVSQSLPVVSEVVSRPKGTWFTIQQPEVHLHPRAQAAIGELIFNMAGPSQEKRFLVETHSDYIIDRFRSSMRKATEAGQPVPTAQIVFFRREEGKNALHSLPLSPVGEYPENQPDGFRAFFLQEELRNLGF